MKNLFIDTEIKISNQVWMAENLDAVHYRNGDLIPQITDDAEWASLTTGAWCYYDNNVENGKEYGKLYNWYAVADPRGLAPEGWHIPSKEEFQELLDAVGANQYQHDDALIAGGSSGFGALFGGHRFIYGNFYNIGDNFYFWAVTPNYSNYAWYMYMTSYYRYAFLNYLWHTYGFSVRCIKD